MKGKTEILGCKKKEPPLYIIPVMKMAEIKNCSWEDKLIAELPVSKTGQMP